MMSTICFIYCNKFPASEQAKCTHAHIYIKRDVSRGRVVILEDGAMKKKKLKDYLALRPCA